MHRLAYRGLCIFDVEFMSQNNYIYLKKKEEKKRESWRKRLKNIRIFRLSIEVYFFSKESNYM